MSSEHADAAYHTFTEGGEEWVFVPEVMEVAPLEGDPGALAAELAEDADAIEPRTVESPLELSHLYLILTSHCNLDCQYCYEREIGFLRERGRMDRETVDRILGQLSESAFEFGGDLTVTMYGGEPTTEPEMLIDVADRLTSFADANDLEIGFEIVTNGYDLSERILDHLVEEEYTVTLSIDGPPDIQNQNRETLHGEGTYGSVRETAETLVEAPIECRFQSTIRSSTLETSDYTLVDVLRHMNEIGFDQGVLSYDHYGDVTDEDRLMLRQMVRYSLNSLLTDDPILLNSLRQLLFGVLSKDPVETCPAGHGIVAFGPDGVVFPCHAFIGDEEFGVDEVDDEQALRALADRFSSERRELQSICQSCWNRHTCLSVCYFDNYVGHGAIDRFASDCRPQKAITEEVLRYLISLRNNPDEFERFKRSLAAFT